MGKATQEASQEQISDAIRVLLATLPAGAEMNFFWRDGRQCFEFVGADGQSESYRLVRRDDGCGTVIPAGTDTPN